MRIQVQEDRFYFITDDYYDKFSDCGLSGNKGSGHNRPCFYCLSLEGYYWMVPISSQLNKYKTLYEEKCKKYPDYDGLEFGFVNGAEKAFLIQNVCPVTEEYISGIYKIQKGTVEVTINEDTSSKIKKKVNKVILMHKKHIRITMTDIDKILAIL